MGAWLEICIDRGPSGLVAGLLERAYFGMTDTFIGVKALANDLAILNDDGPDHCSGAGQPTALLGEFEGSLDVGLIVHGHSVERSCPS